MGACGLLLGLRVYEKGWYRNPDRNGVDECIAPSWYLYNLSASGWHVQISMQGIRNAIACSPSVRFMLAHVPLYMAVGVGVYVYLCVCVCVCACVSERLCVLGACGLFLRKGYVA